MHYESWIWNEVFQVLWDFLILCVCVDIYKVYILFFSSDTTYHICPISSTSLGCILWNNLDC